jgi:hypothetical protein
MNQTALIFLVLTAGLTSLACAIAAAILHWHNRDGWGYFLLAAVVIVGIAASGFGFKL